MQARRLGKARVAKIGLGVAWIAHDRAEGVAQRIRGGDVGQARQQDRDERVKEQSHPLTPVLLQTSRRQRPSLAPRPEVA
jgi:hypothetical protein